MRVGESFVSFGRALEFEREFCGQQLLLFFQRAQIKIAWDSGTKDNAKAFQKWSHEEIFSLTYGGPLGTHLSPLIQPHITKRFSYHKIKCTANKINSNS